MSRDVRSYVFYLLDPKKITFLRYVKKSKFIAKPALVVNKNLVIGRNLGPPWLANLPHSSMPPSTVPHCSKGGKPTNLRVAERYFTDFRPVCSTLISGRFIYHSGVGRLATFSTVW